MSTHVGITRSRAGAGGAKGAKAAKTPEQRAAEQHAKTLAAHHKAVERAEAKVAAAEEKLRAAREEAKAARSAREGFVRGRTTAGPAKKAQPTENRAQREFREAIERRERLPIEWRPSSPYEVTLTTTPDALFLRSIYGDRDLHEVYDFYTTKQLRAMARDLRVPSGGLHEDLVARIADRVQRTPLETLRAHYDDHPNTPYRD